MSTFTVTRSAATAIVAGSPAIGLRLPTDNVGAPGSLTRDLVYTPDLTPAEQALYDRLLRLDASAVALSPTDWEAIEPRLAALRTFRQQPQSEFMAKTANARDRELFDAINDLSAVVLRVLRQ